MQLNDFALQRFAQNRKRVGRGNSSGNGAISFCRGMNGQPPAWWR